MSVKQDENDLEAWRSWFKSSYSGSGRRRLRRGGRVRRE